eukprot:scaffold81382_cov35-Prasinocladus_malaysianus.AAC.1
MLFARHRRVRFIGGNACHRVAYNQSFSLLVTYENACLAYLLTQQTTLTLQDDWRPSKASSPLMKSRYSRQADDHGVHILRTCHQRTETHRSSINRARRYDTK